MAALPRRIDIEFGGRRLSVVHGSFRSINQFIFASTEARVKNRELDATANDGVLAGHCGLPFTQLLGKRLLRTTPGPSDCRQMTVRHAAGIA